MRGAREVGGAGGGVSFDVSRQDRVGADICRVAFEFGLVVTRGDFSTDGVWALVLLTVRGVKCARGREWWGEEEDATTRTRTRARREREGVRTSRRAVRRATSAVSWAYGKVVAAVNAARGRGSEKASARTSGAAKGRRR